ncbi:cytochrome b/b6 domain-containing protein [Ensifer sp. IC3342]|nr:cytochrome b/b6 domain-containing protein [Ensifer sp. BRP08]MCA1447364.1 cytochrome b/b6 domain-containing protein [Ensifer sp. IC3342]
MATAIDKQRRDTHLQRTTIRRHGLMTRVTHWTWAVALFFLVLSGLQIFNAHPSLYIGEQSGFAFDNSVLSIRAVRRADGSAEGLTMLFGRSIDTTGLLGVSGPEDSRAYQAFPAWLTVPSYHDLATGRVVHFFFAWLFAATFLSWFAASLVNGHLRGDILPTFSDIRGLPGSFVEHVRFRFHHGRSYNGLQKISYAIVLLVLFPLMILTGLAMSPGMNAAVPWLTEIFGGRQTARTIHFAAMLLLVGFFAIHIFMVFAAGPINEMRSMVTGRYRIDREAAERGSER